MRIAIDTSRLEGPRTGIHRFLSSLLRHAEHRRHEWVELGRPEGVRSLAYLLHHIPKMARAAEADVILAPHAWDFPGITPIPVVCVLHDVWPWAHLNMSDPHAARHRMLEPFPRRASGVIHVSDFTRRAFRELWPDAEVPDTVVHHGPEDNFTPKGPTSAEGIPDGAFFFACASNDPRKNLFFLADILPRLAAPLVVVGDAPMESVPGAIHLGVCDDERLAILYRRATAFLYPSGYEGFGLPPTEAARCGCPVLVSDMTALPEIMGYDHPGVLPLGNGDHWVETANRLLDDAALRARFVDAGHRAVAKFSWKKTVEEIEDFCDRVRFETAPSLQP